MLQYLLVPKSVVDPVTPTQNRRRFVKTGVHRVSHASGRVVWALKLIARRCAMRSNPPWSVQRACVRVRVRRVYIFAYVSGEKILSCEHNNTS